jgi:glycosyltransferase involved in cell wall biosynthesis
VDGNRDVVKDCANGFLVSVNDDDAMARAVLKLLDDEVLRNRMGEEGHKLLRKEFDSTINVRYLENVYLAIGSHNNQKWFNRHSYGAC